MSESTERLLKRIAELEAENHKLQDLVSELYVLAPHVHLAESPSQARRLEWLYEQVREVLR